MKALPVIALLFCYFMVACQTINTDSTQATATEIAALPNVDCWTYRPRTIIVHPLSYFNDFIANATIAKVSIYIECLDQDQQTTRSLGFLFVHVQDPKSKSISEFKCNLANLSQNNLYWDSVSRCYRIEVPLPKDFICKFEAFLTVNATLNLDADEALTTDGTVYCPHQKP
ncbi:MAG: hypothetical protein EXS12_06205 [Phycisphaerales bacterium]|nr:hypothetical protein [Phycisphaerales bacterium]